MRFTVTGSGRCGTKYMSTLLTAAGVSCGHEARYGLDDVGWGDRLAESSWMAATHLPLDEPTVLLVRHPLMVVKSWVEIGFFGWQMMPDADYNPCHDVLRGWAPDIYDYESERDRALAMWLRINTAALAHAEMVLRLETFDAGQFGRLLRWAGHDRDPNIVAKVFAEVQPCNQHQELRLKTKALHAPAWDAHDSVLARKARALASALGFEVDGNG